MPYLGAAHPPGSSPITIFAGVGDFGAPAVAMRGAGLGMAGNYEAYPYSRKFGTNYLNRPRLQFGAPPVVDSSVAELDKAMSGDTVQGYIQAGAQVLSQIQGIIQAWGQANAAGKAQLAAATAQQTGLTPAQVQALIAQEQAKAQSKTPGWVWPVVGVVGLAAVGGLVFALSK